jgi:hypothetical protein
MDTVSGGENTADEGVKVRCTHRNGILAAE